VPYDHHLSPPSHTPSGARIIPTRASRNRTARKQQPRLAAAAIQRSSDTRQTAAQSSSRSSQLSAAACAFLTREYNASLSNPAIMRGLIWLTNPHGSRRRGACPLSNLAITKSSTWPLGTLARPRPSSPIAIFPIATARMATAPSARAPTAVAPSAITPSRRTDRARSLGPSYRTVCGHLTLLIICHPRPSTLSG
jgi:hypothetical protein